MYVRKIVHKEPFQHPNGTNFSSSSTESLISSTASNWTITNNGTALAYITSPAAGAQVYLTNYSSATPPAHAIFDLHVKASAWSTATNGTEGMGLVFCANNRADSFTTGYRLRQTNGSLFMEELASGTWSQLGSHNTGAALNTDYYYRVLFFRTAYTLQGISLSGPTAGKFYVYRGTSYDNMRYVTSFTDSSGLLSGGYFGIYKGSATTLTSKIMGSYGFWDLDVDYVDISHKLSEDSSATVGMARNTDQLNYRYSIGDRLEIWVPDQDQDTSVQYLRLFFDGQVEVNPVTSKKDYYSCVGNTKELSRLHWYNGTTAHGTVTGYLRGKLSDHYTQQGVNGSASLTSVLHSNGLKTSTTETSRDIRGTQMDLVFKSFCSELGYHHFFYPDGRFVISDTLLDERKTINGSAEYSRMLEPELFYDGRQIVGQVSSYHNGWGMPVQSSNGTSNTTFGVRGLPFVDMLVNDSAVAGRINQQLLSNNNDNLAIAKLTFVSQHMDIFPGMKVGLILPGTIIGTNSGSAEVDTWYYESMTCTEHHFDSRKGTNIIVLVYNDQSNPDTAKTRELPVPIKPTIDRTKDFLSAQDTLSSGYGTGGVTDHGDLTGRDDDDHPQYYNQTRGDARYSQTGHSHSYAAEDHTHVEDDITDLDHTDPSALHDKADVEAVLTGEIASHTHAGSGSPPIAILTKSVATNQFVGGANNTEVWWTWDGYAKLDMGYSFTAASSEITVSRAGWYQIRFVGNVQTAGAARSTLQGILRVNAGATQRKGTIRDYTRGSAYGNCSPGLDCIIELEAGDVIEVGTRVEDTDAVYPLFSNGAEIGDDENLLMITKVG